MPKKRVHEIAKEQGITSKEVLAAFKDAGVYVKAASSTVEERDVKRAFPNGPVVKVEEKPKAEKKKAEPAPAAEVKAPEEPTTADRDADGKAKVPRAKATKGAHAKADTSAEAPAKAKPPAAKP